MNVRKTIRLGAPLIALLVLAGMAVEAYMYRPMPSDTKPYHAYIKEADTPEWMPKDIKIEGLGTWVGHDSEISPAAYKLLRPNVHVQRAFRFEPDGEPDSGYAGPARGEQVSFLLVQSKDTRDINGHYPPICYPGQGYVIDKKRSGEVRYEIDGEVFHCTRYYFVGSRNFQRANLVVDNFIVSLGGIYPNMEEVEYRTGDYLTRFYGAAQVQVVHKVADWTDDERYEARYRDRFRMLIRENMEVIKRIKYGLKHKNKAGVRSAKQAGVRQ